MAASSATSTAHPRADPSPTCCAGKFSAAASTAWPQTTDTGFHRARAARKRRARAKLAATFVGHSTFLLQFARGVNVLTDPIWSERASPVPFAGPRRARRPPACRSTRCRPSGWCWSATATTTISICPPCAAWTNNSGRCSSTGLGNRDFLRRKGLRNVQELDWWQSHPFAGHGNHVHARAALDRPQPDQTQPDALGRLLAAANPATRRGPCSSPGTPPGPHFRLIRERLGAPGLALLPIGAYEPRWFMRDMHMNPDDAVQAHLALEARRSVGMHFGTFQLTDEGIDQPADALSASLRARGVDPAAFRVPRFGETIPVREPG